MIQIYKKRGILTFLFFSASYLIVLANLFYVQVIQHTFFSQLGQKQYHVTTTSFPPRAPILDRAGNFLAINKDSVAAFILPKQLEQQSQLEKFLSKHFPHALIRLKSHANAHFMYIQRKLTPEQLRVIQESKIPDIKLLCEPSRFYPLPTAATIIGATDIDNKGLFGIELQFDSLLSGCASSFILEKDARSGLFYFKKETTSSGSQAQPLQLTLDSDLQFLAYEALDQTLKQFNAQEGSVIIMDPQTGDILAMVNIPNFNPHDLTNIQMESTKNRAITQAYELGSVFKIFTALAALEEGVVTPDELIDCKNTKTTFIDGRKINTVHEAGIIPFEQVITTSNNIGIAQVAKRLDSKIYDHYSKLGFGKKTTLAFPGENKGFINPVQNWSKQSIISLSYGYEISANLLQLARAFCIIANGGYWIEPRITLDAPACTTKQQLYDPATISIIQDILEKTTAKGTAHKARIEGYRVMCKTGTANMLENGHYNPDRNIYTCAGIVEKNGYKKVIVTFVKEAAQKDLYAATVTAPLFEQISQKMLIKDRII